MASVTSFVMGNRRISPSGGRGLLQFLHSRLRVASTGSNYDRNTYKTYAIVVSKRAYGSYMPSASSLTKGGIVAIRKLSS